MNWGTWRIQAGLNTTRSGHGGVLKHSAYQIVRRSFTTRLVSIDLEDNNHSHRIWALYHSHRQWNIAEGMFWNKVPRSLMVQSLSLSNVQNGVIRLVWSRCRVGSESRVWGGDCGCMIR